MEQHEREALQLLGTLRTPGWRVAEELLDAALVLIQDAALDHDGPDTTALTLRAQGARQLVKSFKSALRAASSVEQAEPNSEGFSEQESNE